jgi:hypothetical protein
MVKRVTVDRLILVDVVDHWFRLEQPTFVDAGETYWIDHETANSASSAAVTA